jgi:hypothetical protein
MKPFLSAHLSTPWFQVVRVFKPVYELGDVVYSKVEYQIIERFPRLYYGVPSLAAVNGRLFGEWCLDIRCASLTPHASLSWGTTHKFPCDLTGCILNAPTPKILLVF